MIMLTAFVGLLHLGSAWQPTADALRAGEHLALVKVLVATQQSTGRATTRVEQLAAVDGRPPTRGAVEQTGPHLHTFRAGQLVLMPLVREGKRWRYLAETRQPMIVEPGKRRAAVVFAADWRARPAAEDFDAWIDLLDHPAEVARRVGQEALIARASTAEGWLTDARLDRMAGVLSAPGLPAVRYRERIRLLGALGGRAGAARIAKAFERLPSDAVRRSAVGVLGRFPAPAARRVLERCARDSSGSLKMRCVRVLRRLDRPTP